MKILMGSAFVGGVLVLLAVGVANMKSGQSVVINETTVDTSRVKSENVEREVREGVPAGSSLAAVNDFLDKRNIEHRYNASSKTIYAVIRKLKNGSVLTQKTLSIKFHFNDALSLSSIETKVTYTGP